MRRLSFSVAVVCVCLVASSSLSADVRSDQRVKFQLGGALGKMINMFSKGAREGTTSMVAVKGNRKVTMNGDTTGQIIDLSEEKIYDLDLKKKTYKVTTFAELRRQMQEAQAQAAQAAREERPSSAPSQPSQPTAKDPNQKEAEVDFDLKNTNETRVINGFNTKKSVMTITVREKGKTLNEAGGLVTTTDLWLTDSAPSTKDLYEFDRKYAEKLYGPAVVGASTQDLAMAMAMYPQMKPALDKMAAEGTKINGTAILTEMRMESVPPGTANQTSAALPAPEEPKKKGLGGMLGGLKKMAEEAEKNQNNNSNQKPQRAIVMTTSVEMLKLTTDVDAASVAMPAGFKETK